MNQKKKLVLHQETLRNLSVSRVSRKDTLVFCATDRTCPDQFTTTCPTGCIYRDGV